MKRFPDCRLGRMGGKEKLSAVYGDAIFGLQISFTSLPLCVAHLRCDKSGGRN